MTFETLTEGDIEETPLTVGKSRKFLSKMSLSGLRAQPWAARASEVLSVTGSIAEVAGAAGLPFAGLVGLALKMGAGILKTDDVSKIKDIVTEHYQEIKVVMSEVDVSMLRLREDVISILMLVLDTQYRNGILSIEAAFETFLNIDDSSQGLAEKLVEFRSHKFEVEKDYRHHMSPGKVEEYLRVVCRQQGVMAAVRVWDFVCVVQVTASHCTSAVRWTIAGEIFAHVPPLLLLLRQRDGRRETVRAVQLAVRGGGQGGEVGGVSPHGQPAVQGRPPLLQVRHAPHYRLPPQRPGPGGLSHLQTGGRHPRQVRQEEQVDSAVSREDIHISPCRHPARSDLSGLSLLFVSAEAGADKVCRLLLDKFRVSPDGRADNGFTPAFTAAQFGQNETLKVLAEFGADLRRLIYFPHSFLALHHFGLAPFWSKFFPSLNGFLNLL